MRKTRESVVIILVITFCLPMLAGSQAAQPPMSNASMPGQQSGSRPQMSGEALSPEAQAKLIEKVKKALLMLPYLGVFDNLDFRLRGRTVILQGQVANPALKPDAERAVRKVEGVENVVNNIAALPPSPVDQRLRRAIYRAVYSGPLARYGNDKVNPPIRIIVNNSRVTLEGVVDSEADKNLATIRANQVPGILGSVTNNLRVVK